MYLKNKKKFRRVRFILLKISWLFHFLTKFRTPKKRILLVKIDAIGDYILFRNFLEVLKNSEKYKGYEIELLGNPSWKDIALEYDSHIVSKFYFIDEDPLYEKPRDVFKLGWMLFKRRYELVLQSTYSRTLMGNGLAALAAGKESVAYYSDDEHHPRYKKQTDKLYTKLLKLPEAVYHEFERNHYFFQEITEQRTTLSPGPSIPAEKRGSDTIVIFPGSSYFKRNWEREKFLELIERLITKTEYKLIIAGGHSEVPIASYFKGRLCTSEEITDLTGKTTLPELIQIIANARLVISNETSSVHIAAAVQTPVISTVGGGHFKRFLPYPDHLQFKPLCVYDEMPCYYCNWNCKYHNEFNEPFPCISGISIEKLWKVVTKNIAPVS